MSKSHITGYQICLATNSKFTKGRKTVTVKGYTKKSKKVKGLKAKKKYYVKVRTYKRISGTNYYSPWSKVKTVKVPKSKKKAYKKLFAAKTSGKKVKVRS